jgi:hypothetical protein
MEALQMLKYSFRSGSKLNFTAGSSKEEEEALIEELTAVHSAAPEDLKSYIAYLSAHRL